LDILKSLFDEVLVPEAVKKEIEQGGLRALGLEDFRRADWIRVVPLQAARDELLESLLDIGEAAVISLAREQSADLVLIDERKARKIARDIYGLQPIGTARILVESKKKNLLPDIASQFQKLRQSGYWIHDSIIETALREAGEK
jgi:predicted nucleic acid-binding protein